MHKFLKKIIIKDVWKILHINLTLPAILLRRGGGT